MPYESGVMGTDSVPYEDTFALVGGFRCQGKACGPSNAILIYNSSDDSWIEMEDALKTRLAYATAITVRRSIFPPCPDTSNRSSENQANPLRLIISSILIVVYRYAN